MTNKRVLIFALFLASTATAWAEPYRCNVNGKAVYQETPCNAAAPKGSTAAEIQAEFEREKASKKDGERLKADKEKALEDARRDCQAEKNKPAIVKNSSWDGSVSQVTDYLKITLKDPSSFEAINWGNVVHNCDGYTVFVKYRARNSFGGMVITAQVFNMDRSGKVVSVER